MTGRSCANLGDTANLFTIPNDINEAGETFPGGTIAGNVCWRIRSADVDSLVIIAEDTWSLDESRQFFALTQP